MTWPRPPAPPVELPEGAKPRPAPIPDADSEPFWTGAGAGELRIQRCTRCGHTQLYGRAHCLACRAPVEWVAAAGRGTVYSRTVIRQNPSRSFRHLLPLVVALVDLDEGPRVMSNVVGAAPEDITIGARVRVFFEQVSDQTALPLFELDPDAAPADGSS